MYIARRANLKYVSFTAPGILMMNAISWETLLIIIVDLTLWVTSQDIIRYNALLRKPQLFISSLERSHLAESETSRTFEKKSFG